mgnify:CR=1 FL=1
MCSHDPKGYAGGSLATGRTSQAGQLEGNDPDEKGYPSCPDWGLDPRADIPTSVKPSLFRNSNNSLGVRMQDWLWKKKID